MKEIDIEKYTESLLKEDYNCGEAVVRAVFEQFDIRVPDFYLRPLSSMNGAGRAGAQCGILEGGLFVISTLYGRSNSKKSREPLETLVSNFAREFKGRYGSFLCKEIRKEGFFGNQNRNICNNRIKNGVLFIIDYIESVKNEYPPNFHL